MYLPTLNEELLDLDGFRDKAPGVAEARSPAEVSEANVQQLMACTGRRPGRGFGRGVGPLSLKVDEGV